MQRDAQGRAPRRRGSTCVQPAGRAARTHPRPAATPAGWPAPRRGPPAHPRCRHPAASVKQVVAQLRRSACGLSCKLACGVACSRPAPSQEHPACTRGAAAAPLNPQRDPSCPATPAPHLQRLLVAGQGSRQVARFGQRHSSPAQERLGGSVRPGAPAARPRHGRPEAAPAPAPAPAPAAAADAAAVHESCSSRGPHRSASCDHADLSAPRSAARAAATASSRGASASSEPRRPRCRSATPRASAMASAQSGD